jgi:hypothetical protein
MPVHVCAHKAEKKKKKRNKIKPPSRFTVTVGFRGGRRRTVPGEICNGVNAVRVYYADSDVYARKKNHRRGR